MDVNDGGPAFPCPTWTYYNPDGTTTQGTFANPGISKLDWFAGHALPGVIAGIMTMRDKTWHAWELKDFADEAFKIAETMVAESERRK